MLFFCFFKDMFVLIFCDAFKTNFLILINFKVFAFPALSVIEVDFDKFASLYAHSKDTEIEITHEVLVLMMVSQTLG